MKRFQFRLQPLLRLKEQLKRQAEMGVLQARAALNHALARRDAVLRELDETAAGLVGQVGRPVALAEWVLRQEHARQLNVAIEAAEAALRQAEKALEAAQARRARLATEVEALLHLRRQQWEQYRREVAAAEQERLDELGLRRWTSK